MDKEQTPITKYLASLERRQALLTPSPPVDSAAIIRRISFEDDSFYQDQSLLHVSPMDATSRHGVKRRRLSVLGEVLEEEENLQKKSSEFERLLQQTQGELIEARATNTKLEHQMNENKRCHAERLIAYERSQNDLKAQLREVSEQAESFKEQLKTYRDKEEQLREKLHQQTETHCAKVATLEAKCGALESENLELRGKFESGTLKQSDEMRKLSANLEETEMGAEKWVMETQLLRDQLELKDQQLQKYQNELMEVQTVVCKYNELKARYEQPRSPDVPSEHLEEKVKYFENQYVKQQTANVQLVRSMEKITEENKLLKSTVNKELLLEEQITTFEDEVNMLRASLNKKDSVEAKNADLQSELSSWTTMAFKLDPDCTNPAKFESYIRKLQNQFLESKHETSTLNLTIMDKDRVIAKHLAGMTALHDQLKTVTSEKEALSLDNKKVSRRLVLVTKDRDGLKELKESYEQEFEGMISKPLQDRITQLESTVAEYEALIQENPPSTKTCNECEKRISLISEIREEMERLKREKVETETRLANLSQMGSGDDNTTSIKIVSFGLNPSAMSLESRLREAVKENEELKEKLGELQTAPCSSDSAGKQHELEDRNKTLERKLEILTEAYDFETQQLQVIVNKLFGFHFTLVREPSVQIRLSSIYAHTPNETFIFQESANGDMLLLESPVLDNFRDDIDRYLLREGSIPGFLACVTITYVENQSTQDLNQLPASQQSADETATATLSVHDPREVQVEVRRQRHPTDTVGEVEEEDDEDEEEDDHEEVEDEEDDADEHEDGEPDDEGEAEEFDEEDMRYGEEEEDEDDDHEDEEQDDSEPERDSPSPPRTFYRGRPQNPPAPPPGDESDDSDVIMID